MKYNKIHIDYGYIPLFNGHYCEMTKKAFIKKLKQILSHIRHGQHDTPGYEIIDFFIHDVTQKSGGGWDEVVAKQVMKQIEWGFEVQPVDVQRASLVKENDVLLALRSFLSERGYEYHPIPTSSPQTPDGYIVSGEKKYVFEVKSPLLKFDHKAGSFGYKHTTTHRKILDNIHKAKKQFDTFDHTHEFPHILIYTSAHFQLCWKQFTDAIRGGILNSRDGSFIVDLRKTPVYKSTKELILKLDGYIWLQVHNDKRFYQASYFLNKSSIHFESTNKLFLDLYKRKLSNMDNFINLD